MEEIKETLIEEQNNNYIFYNLHFLKWYCLKKNKNLTNDKEKSKMFELLCNAYLEDPYCFFRILLYIANTRRKDRDEVAYKIVIYFVSVIAPEQLLANIEKITMTGNKKDVLYMVGNQAIAPRVIQWVRHMSKCDSDYAQLNEGTVIDVWSDIKIRYKNKKSDIKSLLEKILDEPLFNGITL